MSSGFMSIVKIVNHHQKNIHSKRVGKCGINTV